MKWYLKVLKHYADFNGRAGRKEYWMFMLFNIIFTLVAVFIDRNYGTAASGMPGLVYKLYTSVVFIPSLAVTVRRLHDIGKSGWMVIVALIPIIGGIWLFVLMLVDSEPSDNQYGPNPKNNLEGYTGYTMG